MIYRDRAKAEGTLEISGETGSPNEGVGLGNVMNRDAKGGGEFKIFDQPGGAGWE